MTDRQRTRLALLDAGGTLVTGQRAVWPMNWRKFDNPPASACNVVYWYGDLVIDHADGSPVEEMMCEGRDERLELGYYEPDCPVGGVWKMMGTGHDAFEGIYSEQPAPTLYATIQRPTEGEG